MTRYRFELAAESDDADLRQILAETPMDGQIAVSFRREPSYFAAAVVEGDFRQVVAARDGATGRIVGFGSRSVRSRFVNGRPQPIGYLGNLRLLADHRNRGLVARGYRFFRELHGDGRAPLYLTTIAAGNETATRLLTSGRAGLPAYHDAGDYHTLAIPLTRQRRDPKIPSGLSIRPATIDDLAAILAFLAEYGPTRQFFPDYCADDFFQSTSTFRDLRPEDFLLAFRGERIVGMLAAWDQHGFRQSVVHRYSGALRWGRPLYNGWARLRGRPSLPKPGESFRYLIAALPIVVNNDATVFRPLLETMLTKAAGTFADYLLLGLHDADPLVPLVRPYRTVKYTTRLYLVCWNNGEALRTGLDTRPPYLELGCL